MIAAAILTPLSLWKMYAFYLYYNTYMGKEIKKMVKILLQRRRRRRIDSGGHFRIQQVKAFAQMWTGDHIYPSCSRGGSFI